MSDKEEPKNAVLAFPPHEEGAQSSEPLSTAAPARSARGAKTGGIILIALIIVAILGYFLARKKGEKNSEANAGPPSVAVSTVEHRELYNEVTIPGEFRPYVEAELNAKVSGYLDKINVDFGDKVKAGQLLAVLEVPELQDELNGAIAAEQRAEADYTNAHLIYNRLAGVNSAHPNLVAQQDIDNAQAKDSTAVAAVTAAKADVGKYQTLFDYTRITAPFDGVITRRYADPGALIQSGMSSGNAPLLRVSDNYRLRLDFPVSVKYVKDVHLGDLVNVQVTSLGGKTFIGTITRFTSQVNETTRTMITEIELPNPNLEVIPGMYAVVVLKVERRLTALAVPTEAVTTGATNTVYTVNQNNKIEGRVVTLGLETPDFYEVTSGLNEGEFVMIGSHSQVYVGESVEPKSWVASVAE